MRTPPDWAAQAGLRHKSRHTAKGRAALCFGPTGGQNRNDASMCSQEPQTNFLRNPGTSIQTRKFSICGCLYGKLRSPAYPRNLTQVSVSDANRSLSKDEYPCTPPAKMVGSSVSDLHLRGDSRCQCLCAELGCAVARRVHSWGKPAFSVLPSCRPRQDLR